MEHFPITAERYSGTYGLLSKKPPRTGVIFVHGFRGKARGTWGDFELLIEQVGIQRSLWSECDLWFYSYRSRDQVRPLAEEFVEFLLDVATKRESTVIGSSYVLPSSEKLILGVPADLAGLRSQKEYADIILVGHSAGAVIIREAVRLILTKMENSDFYPTILNASLRLFAPAHRGVIAADKLGAARATPFLGTIVALYLQSNPLYQNLKIGSPTIVDLRRVTEQLYAERQIAALRAAVLFGKHEEIVDVGGYSHDEELPTEPGHSHTTICKPTKRFLKPLEFVIDRSAIAKNA